jgi:hypothetical protein
MIAAAAARGSRRARIGVAGSADVAGSGSETPVDHLSSFRVNGELSHADILRITRMRMRMRRIMSTLFGCPKMMVAAARGKRVASNANASANSAGQLMAVA